MSSPPTIPTAQDRLARLERQVERERAARLEAERIAERSLRDLYAQKERVDLLQSLSSAANAAGSPEEAMAEALRLVCAHTGWPVGHVFRRRGEHLHPTAIWWDGGSERFAAWRTASESASFVRGEGLPGRVLATGRPAWIQDVATDENFPRAAAAARHGLRGAMAFPVLVDGEVAAVLEFFSEQPDEPDEALLELVDHAGRQLGYVLERQRLRRSHELILSAAGQGIAGLDAAGRTTFVNPTATALTGWTAEELIGHVQHERLHHSRPDGSPYPAEACPVTQVLRDGLERRITGEVLWRRDGTSFPAEYVATPLREAGEIVGAVVVFHDVSEREELKALEEARRELAETNRQLEARVEERTAALSAALASLRESEALLHSVTASALDGIAALEAVRDAEGRVVDFRWLLVNPQAEAMYGSPAESLVGALQSEVIPEVRSSGLHDALARVVETGEPFRQELESTEEPGRWFSLSVSKLNDGIVALFREISEAKRSEAALRASEAQLQAAQSLAHVGSWQWDVAQDRVSWSDELYRIFGFAPGEVEVDYARFASCLHPDDRADIEQAVQRAVETGEGYELNHRIVRPDGTVRWIHSYGEVTASADGRVTSLQGTAQDVTEQVEAEQALQRYAAQLERAQGELRASTEFLQSTLDSLAAHVAILDEEGTVLAVNEAWRRFASQNDYADGQCGLGENYLDACDAPDGEAIAADIARGIRRLIDGEIEQFTAEYPCHSPTEKRWFLLRVTRFVGPEGVRLVTAHENVTEMKLTQAELQRYARDLEESNEELAKFAYVASHDLQEPLRMVTSFLQLLERRYEADLDDAAREYIGYAVDGARRMQRLIRDLLAYSRVGTRGKPFEAVESGEVLLDVLHDLGPAIHDAGAEIEHDALPTVYADPTQLHQLLLNLVGNALKFQRPGEAPKVRIAVAPERLEGGRPGWRFSVTDNGIGVEAQYAERIFQVFQRLHTREEYEGTGIGLAICKKIVERHGGAIAVTSGPEPGATFSFTLPAPPGPPGPTGRLAPEASAPSSAP